MSTPAIAPLQLDDATRENGEKKQRTGSLLSFFAMAGTGGIIGYLVMAVFDRGIPDRELAVPGRLAMLAGLVTTMLLVLAVHELGHLLAGQWVGFRFALFVVGPLRVSRVADGLSWGLNRLPALAGGAVVSAPDPARLDRLRGRYRTVVAGGPLASLLSAAIAAWAFALVGMQPASSDAGYVGRAMLVVFLAGSVLIGFGTLLPNRLGGLMSDGARLIQFSPRNPYAEQDAAVMALGSLAVVGQRPRDWEPALVERAAAPAPGYTGAIGAYMAYSHAIDTGRVEAAAGHLQRALAGLREVPPAQRPAYAQSAAFFEATYRGDAAAARRWLAAFPPNGMVEPVVRLRTEAAVLVAEGRREEALATLAAAREAARRGLQPEGYEEELHRIELRAGPA